MATGFSAVRSGVVMFAIPFVFAFYPEILLIDQALIDPSSVANTPLPGYKNGIQPVALIWLLIRLVLALYLLASALAAYDAKPLSSVWILIRLATAVAVLMRPELVHFTAVAFAWAMIFWHHLSSRQAQMT